ncbi:hypothetical protein [Chthonobacter rhizosphaerae]|uniref:hypothetical protein n=1 Tax=Chthonobacter rhizosphaerae TaxID=2735553 RepID=UPI0015EF98DC|nr:hypothetical protein [Chthonobacter rhizosphaerae]
MSVSGFVGRAVLAVAFGLSLSPIAVSAGELVDRATRAEGLLAEKKPVQALAEVEAAFNAVWDQAPLSFSEALFVTEKPTGFGIYTARPNTVFSPGEDLYVYSEPFGYGYGQDGDMFTIGFDADFELRTAKGQILHSQTGFAAPGLTTRRRNKEFQVFITYNFQGLRPGDYVLVTRLRDKNSDKVGSFELPFQVAAPAP